MCVIGELPSALKEYDLVAPALLWSETLSALREATWRGALSEDLAEAAVGRLASLGVHEVGDPDLPARAYRIAKQLGWAKTYDAEYVALAEILKAPIFTRDLRLVRGAERVVEFVDFT
jgi:predicted nucleic acid-binding protein